MSRAGGALAIVVFAVVVAAGCAGGDVTPNPEPPPPADATRLQVAISSGPVGPDLAFTLDCDGGASVGVPDVPAACARLRRDWAQVFPGSEAVCIAVVPRTTAVRGTFRGTPVDTGFGPCSSVPDRWLQIVGRPALP